MEIVGKPTINPVLFITGKVSGYIVWTIMFIFMAGVKLYPRIEFPYNEYISYSLLLLASLFLVLSLINLGRSTRLGLPAKNTSLKIHGIYKISRNPMYLGVILVTIASIIFTLSIVTILAGLYSIVIYHYIILGEEHFLEERFGDDYRNYVKRVRRYL